MERTVGQATMAARLSVQMLMPSWWMFPPAAHTVVWAQLLLRFSRCPACAHSGVHIASCCIRLRVSGVGLSNIRLQESDK